MNDLQDLDNKIKEQIESWLDELIPSLKKSLDTTNIINTGELKKSLNAKLASDTQRLTTKIIIEYVLQGKFQDLKSWRFSKQPPVDALKKWVLQKGLGKFPFIPGYQNSNRFPISERAADRIAWGIARSWDSKRVTRKKLWRPMRTIFNQLPEIREEIQQKIVDFGYESIAKLLK